MNESVRPLCRHCERGPAETVLGLCRACHETRGIRRLYRVRRADKGPEWERHLRILARRARRGLPVGGLSLAETL
jgi:hypothetical protein